MKNYIRFPPSVWIANYWQLAVSTGSIDNNTFLNLWGLLKPTIALSFWQLYQLSAELPASGRSIAKIWQTADIPAEQIGIAKGPRESEKNDKNIPCEKIYNSLFNKKINNFWKKDWLFIKIRYNLSVFWMKDKNQQ